MVRTGIVAASWTAVGMGTAAFVLHPTSAASQTKYVDTIMLKDKAEIADAAAVNVAIDALVNDAGTCKPRTETCICGFTSQVDELDKSYRIAVARHPSWGRSNTGVEYENPSNGGTVGIVMSNVKRQLAMCGRP